MVWEGVDDGALEGVLEGVLDGNCDCILDGSGMATEMATEIAFHMIPGWYLGWRRLGQICFRVRSTSMTNLASPRKCSQSVLKILPRYHYSTNRALNVVLRQFDGGSTAVRQRFDSDLVVVVLWLCKTKSDLGYRLEIC